MTTRLSYAIGAHARLADGFDPGPVRVGMLAAHQGQYLEISGFPHPLGTAARIRNNCGDIIQGEVVGFSGDRAVMQALGNSGSLAPGAPVYPAGRHDRVAVGNALLGRIVGPMGDPLDGAPEPACDRHWPLHGPATNPLQRGRVVKPIPTGVRAIDALFTIGEGQRVAIVAGSGVGKSVLMGQMLQGVDADIVVVGLIGERAREVSDFVESKITPDIADKTVVIAVAADEVPLLRLRAAMRATAIAEHFAASGQKVLLLIDSLTRVAHAQREIGLALGEPPTVKGYTPSSLALIPGLVERVGVDRTSGGSITAIYTVLADGGDLEDPVVDAARAIVDGHIILSREMAENGIFPAIDVSRSLSRLMPDIVDPMHQAAAAHFRKLWSSHEQNRDLVLMGAYAAGSDPILDEAIERRAEMLHFVGQPRDCTRAFSESHELLVEGFGR
ncbi:MAG: FliI/YscN family ATPase [Sphingomonadaceae bacterium]|nr:FliI/YscN family ATPase [Sphingomonadaceae bacterium]